MEHVYKLGEFCFVDRVFIGMHVAPDLSSIEVETEALLPKAPGGQFTQTAWIRVVLGTVSKADIHMKEGYHFDVTLPYFGVKGEDMRGNEVYRFEEDQASVRGRMVRLRSDLLDLDVVCQTIHITVLEIEA